MEERTFTQEEVNKLIGSTKQELKEKHAKEIAELNSKLEDTSKEIEDVKTEKSELEKIREELNEFKNETSKQKKVSEFTKKLSDMGIDEDTINLLSQTTNIDAIEDYDVFKKFAKSPLESTPTPSAEGEEVEITEEQANDSIVASVFDKLSKGE